MRTFSRSILVAAVAGLAATFQAQAAFVVPDFRGDADTTYQEWNFFTTTTDATPDIGVANPNGTPTVSAVTGSALTSGNIYAFGALNTFNVEIPLAGLPGYMTKVVLQTRTQGDEIDDATLNIGGVTPSYSEELSRIPLGGFGGDLVDYYFEFMLPTNEDFSITFSGWVDPDTLESHMSFDALVVDTLAVEVVPEAGSLVLASLVAAGFGGVYLCKRAPDLGLSLRTGGARGGRSVYAEIAEYPRRRSDWSGRLSEFTVPALKTAMSEGSRWPVALARPGIGSVRRSTVEEL